MSAPLMLTWSLGACAAAAWEAYATPKAATDVRFAAAAAYRSHDPARMQAACKRIMDHYPVNLLALLVIASFAWPYVLYKAGRTLWNWRGHHR